MRVPDKILDELELISTYMGDNDNWMDVKVFLLRGIRPEMRKLFSTRDHLTKKPHLNDFERHLIDIYKNMTGVRLRIKDG